MLEAECFLAGFRAVGPRPRRKLTDNFHYLTPGDPLTPTIKHICLYKDGQEANAKALVPSVACDRPACHILKRGASQHEYTRVVLRRQAPPDLSVEGVRRAQPSWGRTEHVTRTAKPTDQLQKPSSLIQEKRFRVVSKIITIVSEDRKIEQKEHLQRI
jgi:hypothetical protein